MKKTISFIVLVLALTAACKTTEIVIPEGTDPEVAAVMQKFNIQQSSAEKLLDALENNSALAGMKLEDISYANETVIRGRRVLKVVSGRDTMYVNLE